MTSDNFHLTIDVLLDLGATTNRAEAALRADLDQTYVDKDNADDAYLWVIACLLCRELGRAKGALDMPLTNINDMLAKAKLPVQLVPKPFNDGGPDDGHGA